MKVQTVFIRAFLAIHEELAEFRSSKRGSQHSFVQLMLVY